MGAGKSAVGRHLARTLHLAFVDSDDEVESRTGVDIAFIFEKEGEEGFRKREAAAQQAAANNYRIAAVAEVNCKCGGHNKGQFTYFPGACGRMKISKLSL